MTEKNTTFTGKKWPYGWGIISIFLLLVFSFLFGRSYINNNLIKKTPKKANVTPAISKTKKPLTFDFHGPRFGAKNVPDEYGFWSFAIVDPGKLSRSGQPNKTDFAYLKKAGYKTIINLRYPGEYNEETDDAKIAGAADFNYISIPIKDGAAPTNEQAKTFLKAIKNNTGLIHVHCRGGIGRTGVMTALYRFEINGWPMEKAIEESRLFEGGVDSTQRDWLLNWAAQKNKK